MTPFQEYLMSEGAGALNIVSQRGELDEDVRFELRRLSRAMTAEVSISESNSEEPEDDRSKAVEAIIDYLQREVRADKTDDELWLEANAFLEGDQYFTLREFVKRTFNKQND